MLFAPDVELFMFALMVLVFCVLAAIWVEEPPGSDALSEFRLEYWDKFSARLEREIDLAKPEGPAVNYAISYSRSSLNTL